MKKIIKFILEKISRVIYYIIPKEYKESKNHLFEKINENLVYETFEYFEDHFKKSVLFRNESSIREYAIQTSLFNDKNKEYYYLEFGVWQGESANFFSKFVNKLYCFDSFEGLKEDWLGTLDRSKRTFNLNKKIPNLNSNIEPVVGWVEDTLNDFLKKHNPKINFIHFDMDTYSPTKYTLERIKPYLINNSILIFDEMYNYAGWKEGEFKALKEVFNDNELKYRAFNLDSYQCVVQIKLI